jgi:phosphoribosylanthranilate isomerase
MFVKICGLTRASDAEAVREAGADAIGINLWSGSKRYVDSLARAKEIAQAAAPLVTVAVFVNPTAEEVSRALEVVELAQLHGDETPAFAAQFSARVVRAVRVRDPSSLHDLAAFECPFYLLDADAPGYGGGGAVFDWSLAQQAAQQRKILLAGGLTPENVAEAVRVVRPFGVDVASGVESAPGIKDVEKMKRFIAEAKGA